METSKNKHDFGWGDTRGIRAVMAAELKRIGLNIYGQDLGEFGYPAHEGEPQLVEEVRKLIKDLTGRHYSKILITNGATHALNAFIFAHKSVRNIKILSTNDMYFSFYPLIADIHGLEHKRYQDYDGTLGEGEIGIIDSPSNPKGRMLSCRSEHFATVGGLVWDAAYHTPTYCGVRRDTSLVCPPIIPGHEAMVGSLNKLTGINGLRVGWLATNHYSVFDRALNYVEADLCGVSAPSQAYALQILKRVELQPFYAESKRVLDNNREELQRLSYLFGGQPIFPYGMFALFESDGALQGLFKRANVIYKPGDEIGASRDHMRLNLANTNEATKAMVEAVLKADKA
jgi:aspartate/methionine/tyrosine aminotransferase